MLDGDPEHDRWRPGPELPGAETHMAVVTLGRDRLPLPLEHGGRGTSGTSAGGAMNGVTPSKEVDVYDPRTDAWRTLPNLPEQRKGAVARQVGQRVVVSTGSPTSTDPIDTTFVGCCL